MDECIYSLPNNFLQKLKKLYPERFEEITQSFLEKKPITFRVNYLKTNAATLRQLLRERHISFSELDYPQEAFILKTPLRLFQNTDIYQKGLVYIQNVSSMLVALALEPKDSEKILDLCAAPGAKTTHIASLAPQAKITAIEPVRKRYYKLLANLQAQGVHTVKTLLLDGIWVRKKFPEYFDKILVDAPCSGEGRFLVPEPKTYKYWKDQKVKEMVNKQKKLLAAAFYALKEEGELVYATCTLSPEENEGMIDWLLNKHKDNASLVALDFPIPQAVPGFTRWKDSKFSTSLRLTRRIIPDKLWEGFFIAKLKKTAA